MIDNGGLKTFSFALPVRRDREASAFVFARRYTPGLEVFHIRALEEEGERFRCCFCGFGCLLFSLLVPFHNSPIFEKSICSAHYCATL